MRLMPLGPPRVSYEMGILLQNMFGLSDAIVDEAIMERIPLALASLLVTTDPSLLSLVLSLLVATARRAELLRRREKLQYHREKEAASQAAQPPGAVVCIRPPSNAVADDLAEGDAVPQLQAIAQSPNAENRTAAEFLLLLVEREEKRGTGEMDEDTDSSPEDTEQYNDNDNDIDNDDDDDADADVDDGAIANSNESSAMDVA